MTLSELASFITTKLSDTDSSSVAVCKSFINRRAQMIWDSALWTETLGIASTSVAASATEVVLSDVPSITFFNSGSTPTTYIDFPVACRFTETGQTDGVELLGYDWMSFFQIDVNAWNSDTSRLATPRNFVNLPKNSSGYARLKPIPVPLIAGTLYTLGKLKFVTLGDSDSFPLRGADNALLAFAEADMLERARQYGKAQAKQQEAAAHLSIMRDIEKGQQQSVSRIAPMEEGYFDPTGGPQ